MAVCQDEKWIGDQEVVDEELLASGSAPPTPVNRRRGEAREGGRRAKYFEVFGRCLRSPQRQCDIMKKTMEMRRTDKWLESDQRGGDLV